MAVISSYFVPCSIALILLYGLVNNVSVFDTFIEGAKEGAQVAINILPSLVLLYTAIGMFKASGGLDMLCVFLAPLTNVIMLPKEVLPLALVRPISGNGAMVIFKELLSGYGPDSFIGRVASVMHSASETTVYTMAIYYGSVNISKTRHSLFCSLCTNLAAFIASAAAVKLLFTN